MSDMSKLVNTNIVLKEDRKKQNAPFDCPICNLSFRDINDIISYEMYECCTDCQNQFVYRDKEAWLSGARPTKDEIEKFKQYLNNRPSYLL